MYLVTVTPAEGSALGTATTEVLVSSFTTRVPGEEGAKITALYKLRGLGATDATVVGVREVTVVDQV